MPLADTCNLLGKKGQNVLTLSRAPIPLNVSSLSASAQSRATMVQAQSTGLMLQVHALAVFSAKTQCTANSIIFTNATVIEKNKLLRS